MPDEEIEKYIVHFSVSTNDSKFDDVRQIIQDVAKDLQAYCITNYPLNDGNFIHNGAAHVVVGMQYGEMKYGSQLSISLNGMKYRILNNGIWSEWQSIGKTGNVASLITDFNSLIESGVYSYGGQNLANKPARFRLD